MSKTAVVHEAKALVTAYARVFDAIAEVLPSCVIRLDACDQHLGPR